jgi:DNA-directed RNA polymerase specialized sigma24 family protein
VPYDPDVDETYVDPPSADQSDWFSSGVIDVVEKYVAGLERPLRELHHSRYVVGKSQREAAESLGLSRQNVRTLEERLKSGLRAALVEAWHAERSVRDALEGTQAEPKLAVGRIR